MMLLSTRLASLLFISLLLISCGPAIDIELPSSDGLRAYPIGIHDAQGTNASALVISRYASGKPVLIYLPNSEGPHPLVIFQHGRPFTLPSNSPYYPSNALVNATIAQDYALAVVIRGGYFGVSGPDTEAIPCNRPAASDFATAGQAASETVADAYNYLSKLRIVNSSKIILAGTSAGGFAAINALVQLDEQVAAVISINGGRCGSRGEATGGLSSMRALYKKIATEASTPVYFLSGGSDTVIPLYSTRSLFMEFCQARDDCVERNRTQLFINDAATHDVTTMMDVYNRALIQIARE